MKITFLGLGIMGSRMASNLLKTHPSLTVWNRSPEPAEQLATKGATHVSDLNEAVANADIVISMLSNPHVVREVMMNNGAALSTMKSGAIWMDSSTVNPSFSREAGEYAKGKGIRFIDGPVAGSKATAEAGQLVFYCGGEATDIETVTPYAEMMGQKAMHMGPTGQGSALKMLVNGMLAQNMAVFSETIAAGEALGINRDMMLSLFPELPVMAPFTKFKKEALRAQDYSDVHFPLEHMHKDIRLLNMTAGEVGKELQMAKSAEQLFARAEDKGLAREDFSAVYEVT